MCCFLQSLNLGKVKSLIIELGNVHLGYHAIFTGKFTRAYVCLCPSKSIQTMIIIIIIIITIITSAVTLEFSCSSWNRSWNQSCMAVFCIMQTI